MTEIRSFHDHAIAVFSSVFMTYASAGVRPDKQTGIKEKTVSSASLRL